MKVLVICQYYWPEQFQITDICEELVSRGHRVTVLTGLPNVNLEGLSNIIPAEYKDRANWKQEHNGVTIKRCHEVSRKTGLVNRMRNYYSYWKSANRAVLSLDSEFDIVFAYQLSPGMMSEAAIRYKEKTGVPVVLYCCDLWPESLKAWLKNRFKVVVNHYGKVCRRIYQGADQIIVQSPDFSEYFVKYHGIDLEKIHFIPQFASDELLEKKLIKKHEGINLMFFGNMGSVQGINYMLEAINLLKKEHGLVMHFVGDGECFEESKRYVKINDLSDKVIFHGRRLQSEMEEYYKISDLCILGLDDSNLIGSTIPSKLQGYMAAGKPVLGAVGGGARTIIEESCCGQVVPFGDPRAMAVSIKSFMANDVCWDHCGENGRTYFKTHFTKTAFMDSFEDILIREFSNSYGWEKDEYLQR